MTTREKDGANQQTLPISISEQYRDASYSDFVEANPAFYENYLHFDFFQELKAYVDEKKDSCHWRILDLGCGNGILSRKIWKTLRMLIQANDPKLKPQEAITSMFAVDLMDSMLERAHKLCYTVDNIPILKKFNCKTSGIFFRQGDLLDNSLNNEDGIPKSTFDMAVTGFVLAHMEKQQDIRTVLLLAHESLIQGGLSMNLIPATRHQADEGSSFRVELPFGQSSIILYDVHWKDSTYIKAMEQAGFVDVTIQELHFNPSASEEWMKENNFVSGYKLLKGRKADKSTSKPGNHI